LPLVVSDISMRSFLIGLMHGSLVGAVPVPPRSVRPYQSREPL